MITCYFLAQIFFVFHFLEVDTWERKSCSQDRYFWETVQKHWTSWRNVQLYCVSWRSKLEVIMNSCTVLLMVKMHCLDPILIILTTEKQRHNSLLCACALTKIQVNTRNAYVHIIPRTIEKGCSSWMFWWIYTKIWGWLMTFLSMTLHNYAHTHAVLTLISSLVLMCSATHLKKTLSPLPSTFNNFFSKNHYHTLS